MDNKCVAKNNCRHIYFIIHTVHPRLSKTLHNQQQKQSYSIKHFNDIHIVIKLTQIYNCTTYIVCSELLKAGS